MEGFKYVDIFASKGIEYLFVIGFLAVLVFFWKWLNKSSVSVKTAVSTVKENAISLIDWFYLADDFYYHQGHSWAAPESKDVVKVGIDDFAQKLLGKPGEILLPKVGDQIRQGENGMRLTVDSKTIDILSPVEGEVVAVNNEAINSPELVNEDPYKKGWLLKVRVPKMNANLKNLLSGKLARAWMEDTVARISKTMTADVSIVMQDGGIPMTGFVKEISKNEWEQVAREFLLTLED
jgi:glycine cleavage system H lipoate-binding protein